MPQLPFGDKPLTHDLTLQDNPTGDRRARLRLGVQTITMTVALLTLTVGYTATAGEQRILNNVVAVNPDAADRAIKLPSAADLKGYPLTIGNTNTGHSLEVQTSAGDVLLTIAPTRSVMIISDGSGLFGTWMSADGVQTIRKLITNAQLRALNATPISVIAAPGAGKYIDVIRARYFYNTAGTAFDNVASGENVVLRYTNGSGTILTVAAAGVGLGDQTTDQYRSVPRVATELTPTLNAAVVAHILSGEWYAAAGDATLAIEVDFATRIAAF